MKDNLSIVILMIVFVMLVVMFPLYNFFERQDDMSYNLALKATTTFVEKVLNYGYLDSEMYDEFTTELASTGNLYDIEFEAHIQTITLNPDDKTSNTYITQSKIEYNDDIFSAIETPNIKSATLVDRTVKNGMYKLNIGDGFYVKLKNSNTTMAGALFNSIISTSSTERIVINYGGIVKNNAWYKIDATYMEKNDEIIVSDDTSSSTKPQGNEKNPDDSDIQDNTHKHTDSCYQKCNGNFEIVRTYQNLVHTCDYRPTNCHDSIKELTTCPYSSIDNNYYVSRSEITSYNRRIRCPICRKNISPINSFTINCKYCSYKENIDVCLRCVQNYQTKSAISPYKIGKHQAYICPKTKPIEFYRDVQVLECKTCNAMYKKYLSYDNTCALCNLKIHYDEEIEGVKGQHNIIKICGYD